MNDVALLPVSPKPVRFSVFVPVFCTVNDWAALVLPSAVGPNVSPAIEPIACACVIDAKNIPHTTTMQRTTQRVAVCLSE